jgi:hypothetical protein
VSEDISLTRELGAVALDVGSVFGVRGEARDDGRLVASLVVEVVGVLRLDERWAGSRERAGTTKCSTRVWPPVVVELSLIVEVFEVVTGELATKTGRKYA